MNVLERLAALVVVVLLAGWLFASSVRAGAAGLRYRARVDSLTTAALRVDTVRKTDSVRVVRTVARLDTLRVSVLERLTDTVAVREYVYRTDTLRQACLACVQSASRLRAVNDSLRTAYTRLVGALERQKPKRWQKYVPLAAGVAGFLLGAKLRP